MSSGDLLGNQAGGLDNRTLDSLYNDALRRNNQNASYDPWEPALGGNMMQPTMHNPFFASNTIAAPPFVQMASRCSCALKQGGIPLIACCISTIEQVSVSGISDVVHVMALAKEAMKPVVANQMHLFGSNRRE
ncbi:hypothetical protein JHK82_027456 [Glycine max]|nr:hypothetical protein JHK82_027456 [Glycine max]